MGRMRSENERDHAALREAEKRGEIEVERG